jgi:hypothetical protein
MPDPHRIEGELLTLLSRPQYSSIFHTRNQFRNVYTQMKKPNDPVWTPQVVAKQTAEHVWKANGLLDPVEVLELKGPVELYRAYDGGVRLDSARTLGRYWFERRVIEEIWNVSQKHPGASAQQTFMDFLRAANFILPEWNDMKELAVMLVPAGASVVVIRGKGNWKAMRTPPTGKRPAGAPSIGTQADVITHLGFMPTPGTTQCVVPLFNDSWITQVPRSPRWPLFS